jgi:hypothetical protein
MFEIIGAAMEAVSKQRSDKATSLDNQSYIVEIVSQGQDGTTGHVLSVFQAFIRTFVPAAMPFLS